MKFSQVLGGNESAGIQIGQVDDIYTAGTAGADQGIGVVGITDQNTHPGRRSEEAVAGRIGLRKQFRHTVFGVYFLNTESRAKECMQLLPCHLFSFSFHSSRFHDYHVSVGPGILFGKIEQCIGEADQEYFSSCGMGLRQAGMQPGETGKKIPAFGALAEIHQSLQHKYQGGVAILLRSRCQGQELVFIGGAVEPFESLLQGSTIQIQVGYKMPALDHSRGPAAAKDSVWRAFSAYDVVGFKKPDR